MRDEPMHYSRASDWSDPPEDEPQSVWHILGPYTEDFAHSVGELHEIVQILVSRGEPFTVTVD